MRVTEKMVVFDLLARRLPGWSGQFWAKYNAIYFIEILLQYIIIIIIIIIIIAIVPITIITIVIIIVSAMLNIATEVSNMTMW